MDCSWLNLHTDIRYAIVDVWRKLKVIVVPLHKYVMQGNILIDIFALQDLFTNGNSQILYLDDPKRSMAFELIPKMSLCLYLPSRSFFLIWIFGLYSKNIWKQDTVLAALLWECVGSNSATHLSDWFSTQSKSAYVATLGD